MTIKVSTPYVPVSWGELVDKISILEIKEVKIESEKSKENIRKELQYLLEIALLNTMPEAILKLKTELYDTNLRLWTVEDKIREKDLHGEFDETFIELARSVYRLNDVRAKLKKSINVILQSELIEEKSYKDFDSHI